MTTPVSEDTAAITKRIAELQAERLAVAIGCNCPVDSTTNDVVHKSDCPLYSPLVPSSIVSPNEVARIKAQWDELNKGFGNSARATLVSMFFVLSLAFDPHILFLSWSAERQEQLNATNLQTCTQAMMAISEGRWLADDPPKAMRCFRGNGFSADSQCIKHFNCEDRK